MLICHSCGTPVQSESKQCHRCHNAVSAHASVALLEPPAGNPLKVQLQLQPKTLENLIACDLIKAVNNFAPSPSPAETLNEMPPGDGNGGHSSNGHEANGNGGNGHGRTELTNQAPTEPAAVDFFAQLPQMLRNVPSGETQKPELEPPRSVQEAPSAVNLQDKINWSGAVQKSEQIPSSNSEVEASPAKVNDGFAGVQASPEENKEIESTNVNRRSFSAQKPDKNRQFNLQKSDWIKLGIASLVVLFILLKGFQVFYSASCALLAGWGNTGPAAMQANPISGRWKFAGRWDNGTCQGQMVLHQQGNQLFGEGSDNGPYKFQGTRDGDHIEWVKQYFNATGFVGHPIQLNGDIDSNSRPLFAHGDFKIDYMQGGKWRGKPVVIAGNWEAEMIQPLIEDESAQAEIPNLHKIEQSTESGFMSMGAYLSKNGLWIVAIGLVVGWSAWHFMSSLIGPDGWLGIWDKQKYVPPQFMKEHRIEKRQLSRPLAPGSLPLGQRWEWQFWQKYLFWVPKDMAIPPDVRANNPHVLILGGGEKGKSRLMANMITHDIESADRAVVLVDSDGDLADMILRWVAGHADGEQISKRVIVIDPTGNMPSPSFNPLEWPEDNDIQRAASSIVHGFKAIYHEPPGSQNQWSPQTAHILRNAAMLLMANGKTLVDLPTLLQDNDTRDIMLANIEKRKDERIEFATLLETWGQYKRLARTEEWIRWFEPILNRVSPTLINLRIRPILTQAKGEINLKQLILDKQILIVKIPKGQLHDDANLLGSLIVTSLKQAAITLCTENKITDRTVALYLDEFDNFIEKETLDAITTETKKFQLGFVGSTKTLQHMPEDFRNQIVINIGTMCVFALSKKDGDMIGPQMFRVSGRKAKHRTLMNILNKVNTSPQFELISDEEKYNIDRILGQSERQFYAYRVGTVAGIFRMKSHDFNDIPEDKVQAPLIEQMHKNR